MFAARACISVLFVLSVDGCGTSLCDQRRDPDALYCTGLRIDLAQAIQRARGRQPELADATLVLATSGNLASLNVDGKDDEWRLIFVVADGSSRTLAVRPTGTPDVNPGGGPETSCDGAVDELLPSSIDSTQNAVLHYEIGHGPFLQGPELGLELFYEHECYDAVRARAFHVHVTQATEIGPSHWFYRIDGLGLVDQVCGPCELNDVTTCVPCVTP